MSSGSELLGTDLQSRTCRTYGIEPVQACSCSPLPGGLWWKTLMTVLGYFTTMASVVNFVSSGRWWCACAIAWLMLYTIRCQLILMPNAAAWRQEFRTSYLTGFIQPGLCKWFTAPVCSKHAFSVLIISCGGMQINAMNTQQAVLYICNYLVAISALVQQDVAHHLGDELAQIGGMLVTKTHCGKAKLLMLSCWSICHIMATVGLTAMIVIHWYPLIGLALFIPAAAAKYQPLPITFSLNMQQFVTEPLDMMTFQSNSVFCLPFYLVPTMQYGDPVNVGNQPAKWLCLANLIRIAVSVLLLYKADWPHGCEGLGCTIYRVFFTYHLRIVVPLDVVAMLFLLVLHPAWREGHQDVVAAQSMESIAEQLVLFQDDISEEDDADALG